MTSAAQALQTWLIAIAIGLQGWTLTNVVDVRERVARLEALQQARRVAPSSTEKSFVTRIIEGDCHGVENLLRFSVVPGKAVAHCARHELEGGRALFTLAPAPIHAHQVSRVHDPGHGCEGSEGGIHGADSRGAVLRASSR